MKATEFVKKFGWEVAEDIADSLRYGLATDQKFTVIRNMVHRSTDGFTLSELERLVESHETVDQLGGLERAKKTIEGRHVGYTHFYLHSNDRYVFLDVYVDFIPDHAFHIGMVNKAIADVESCNAT